MSNLRMKAIPAALAAAGIMSMSSIAFAADQAAGVPGSGVYAQGTFNPPAYAIVSKNLYAPAEADAATATGGFIFVTLEKTQKAWGYALSESYNNGVGTHTVSHTLTTGSNTCTVKYEVSYDPAGILTVTYRTATSSLTTTLAASTCRKAFASQTGLPDSVFQGTAAKREFNLIY